MASAGDVSFLPLEIVTNIFKRLPIKSIIRFRSLCKDWKNLFKNPHFIAEHAHHFGHENPLLLFIERDSEHKGTPLSLRLVNHKMESLEVLSIPSFHSPKYDWHIIGSCNGLLLVEIADYGYGSRFPRSLFLWNPMIREVRRIPHTPENDHFGWDKYGLGFSSIVHDYKIVRFYNLELLKKKKKKNWRRALDGHQGVEVYSLSTSSWKEIELGAIKGTTITSTAVSTDGTILWLGVRKSFHVVVSFDIATGMFTLTPIPMPVRDFYPYGTTLGLYQNKFYVFKHDNHGDSYNSIDSWVMEEVAGESGKSFSCTEVYNFTEIEWFFKPLCIWRNEIVCHDEDYKLDRKSKFFLLLFNITTKEWKEFRNFSCDTYRCNGCSYERSLVSVWSTETE